MKRKKINKGQYGILAFYKFAQINGFWYQWEVRDNCILAEHHFGDAYEIKFSVNLN